MNFPAYIDNSMRKAFSECPTRFMRRYCENLVVVQPNVDLHFGACFARGIEQARKAFYGTNWGEQEAVQFGIDEATTMWGNFQPPPLSNKTLPRLIGALRYYFEQWLLGEDGLTPVKDGIECSFAIDLPIMHPETGLPLQYGGKFDMLAIDTNGRYYVVDEKTTSKLGDAWYKQWDLDSQMSGYIWATQHKLEVEQKLDLCDVEVMAQIRGISILRNDYGHVEVPIVRSNWRLHQWHEQLLHDVERMLRCWKAKWFDQALNGQCVAYGRDCDYKKLCMSPAPECFIEGNYRVEVWNPLEKR